MITANQKCKCTIIHQSPGSSWPNNVCVFPTVTSKNQYSNRTTTCSNIPDPVAPCAIIDTFIPVKVFSMCSFKVSNSSDVATSVSNIWSNLHNTEHRRILQKVLCLSSSVEISYWYLTLLDGTTGFLITTEECDAL